MARWPSALVTPILTGAAFLLVAVLIHGAHRVRTAVLQGADGVGPASGHP